MSVSKNLLGRNSGIPAYSSFGAGILAVVFAVSSFSHTLQAAKILYVERDGLRDTTKLINILKAQGHELTIHTGADGNTLTAGEYHAMGYDLLIADEVISSGVVGDRFRDSPVPVITWEGFLYNGARSSFNADSDVTGGTYPNGAEAQAINGGLGADHGQVLDETAINIVDPDHPLAAGLSLGETDLFDPNLEPSETEGHGVITFAGGRTFISGVNVVATVPGFSSGYALFGVEEGTPNNSGVPLPARWVHLPWNDTDESRVMIEPSFFLFEAAVAWSLKLPEPTKIHDLLPESAGFLPVEQSISFRVDKTTRAGSPVSQEGIDLTLNGESVIGSAQITDGGDSWNVVYSVTLEKNATYDILVSATAADGGFSARSSKIDTFSTDNYILEAEDFNFGGGMYFDDPILCNQFGGGVDLCYFDRLGVEGVDEHEINFVYSTGGVDTVPSGTEVYRFSNDPQGVSRGEFVDTYETTDELRPRFSEAGFSDYHVSNFGIDEWVNYTRSFPAGNYKVFARVSSAGPLTLQMDLIDDGTSASQSITGKAGRFISSGTGGNFVTVPLTDDTGTLPLVVSFDGAPQTIRITSLSEGAIVNFFSFAETTEVVQVPPVIAITSPSAGSAYSEGDSITLSADASDDSLVTQVQFFAGIGAALELIATDTEAPYEATFTPPVLGQRNTYTLKAVATDDSDLQAEASILVEVNDPSIQVVSTAHGAGADAELRENDGGDSGNGTSDRMNARINATGDANRREVMALRFDFGDTIMSEITAASLNLVSFRNLGTRNLHVYGVKAGAVGGDNNGTQAGFTDNDWEESGTTFSTMPGLVWDGDISTRGINAGDVVDLGVWNLSLSQAEVGMFNTAGLVEFLQASPDGLVTFIIDSEDDGNGQARFATKEATALDGGTPSGQAGDFAPSMTFQVGGNLPPTVAITSPTDGAQFTAGASVTVTADTSDEGSIVGVDFYVGDTLLSSDTEAPYEATFTPSANGNLALRVIATDDEGATAEASISITILAPSTLPPTGKLGTIVWVGFHPGSTTPSADAASAGFTEASDKAYTDLLEANGFHVVRYVTTSNPDPAVLEAADLVIIGRAVNSGDYSNDGASAWNNLKVPMIVMSGYTLRNNRMGYTTGGTMVDTTGNISLSVADPSHPIFQGISLTDGVMDNPFAGVVTYPTDGTTLSRGVSINTDAQNGGTLLASIANADGGPEGGLVIAEWAAGSVLSHAGGAGNDTLPARRLVFLSGSREADGITSHTAGLYDLTDDGAKMFVNAVHYMLHPEPYSVVWVSFHPGSDAPGSAAADAGFASAPDRDYTDLLEANGYQVTRVVTSNSPDVEALSQADLVIIGRSVNSGDYSNDAATAWNSIQAPVMVMSGYTLRNSRMGFTSGGTMVDTVGNISLTVADPTHAIFSGIPISGGVTQNPFAGVMLYPTDGTTLARGISINTDSLNGGTLLASISNSDGGPEGGMVIAEWDAGSSLVHAGGAGTDVLTASRLVFLSGSREADGTSSQTSGLFDLKEDGTRMFLNAVRYGVSRKPNPGSGPGEPPILSFSLSEQGITLEWAGEATLETTDNLSNPLWQPIDGAGSPYTTKPEGNLFFRLSR